MNYAGLAFVACVLLFPLILKLIRRIILLWLHDGAMYTPMHQPVADATKRKEFQSDYYTL